VHRGALVNVARVQRLDRMDAGELVVVLRSGVRVGVSRARRAGVMRVLCAR
jgi:DNA-binding LytR/AlgR family response regulator